MISAISINKIKTATAERISTGFEKVDELLGGGVVSGSVIMFAGEPGVGKSTLWLQVANNIAQERSVLYASGEESLSQTKMRADRLNALNPSIVCSENVAIEDIEVLIDKIKPKFVIVDSLQMIYSRTSSLTPGSPTQMKKGLLALIEIAKRNNIAIVVIGHCTKSGLIAGMLTLQHMVDVTLFMRLNEDATRTIEVKKNRFGTAQTVASFEMKEQGFIEVGEEISIIQSDEFSEFCGSSRRQRTNYSSRNFIDESIYWIVYMIGYPIFFLWNLFLCVLKNLFKTIS